MPIVLHKVHEHWVAEPVTGACGLLHLAPVRYEPGVDAHADWQHACVVIARAGSAGPWVLVVRSDQRLVHNGLGVAAGIRVLAHMDALALAGHETLYFSTEETPRILPFEGASGATCPRCRSDILLGQLSVRCPACGVVHHQMEDCNCWTYAPACAVCPRVTALDIGLQWTPELL